MAHAAIGFAGLFSSPVGYSAHESSDLSFSHDVDKRGKGARGGQDERYDLAATIVEGGNAQQESFIGQQQHQAGGFMNSFADVVEPLSLSVYASVTYPASSPDTMASSTLLSTSNSGQMLASAGGKPPRSGASHNNSASTGGFSRPLPDQSVFSTGMPMYSRRNSTSHRSPSNLIPTCPPTPTRTPVWQASSDGKRRGAHFGGQRHSDSLTDARVLMELHDDGSGTDFLHDVGASGGGTGKPLPLPLAIRAGEDSALSGRLTLDDLCGDSASSRSSSAASSAAVPVSFDREFHVTGVLGIGSSSKVIEVVCRQAGPDGHGRYAIKKALRPMKSLRDRENHLREFRAAMRVGPHPSLIRYQRAWQEDGHLFFQTELCPGGTVRDAESRLPPTLPVPERSVWTFLAHVSAALAHMHARGWVHLDVKPDNVLVDSTGWLKLADLGIAGEYDAGLSWRHSTCPNMYRRRGSTDSSVPGLEGRGVSDMADEEGDSRYMAQELLSVGGRTPPADIFSLGISAYELAWNEAPPTETGPWQAIRQGNVRPCGPEKGRSAELLGLVLALLHPDPASRPTAAQVLALPQCQAAMSSPDPLFLAHVLSLPHSAPKAAARAAAKAVTRAAMQAGGSSSSLSSLLSSSANEGTGLHDLRAIHPDDLAQLAMGRVPVSYGANQLVVQLGGMGTPNERGTESAHDCGAGGWVGLGGHGLAKGYTLGRSSSMREGEGEEMLMAMQGRAGREGMEDGEEGLLDDMDVYEYEEEGDGGAGTRASSAQFVAENMPSGGGGGVHGAGLQDEDVGRAGGSPALRAILRPGAPALHTRAAHATQPRVRGVSTSTTGSLDLDSLSSLASPPALPPVLEGEGGGLGEKDDVADCVPIPTLQVRPPRVARALFFDAQGDDGSDDASRNSSFTQYSHPNTTANASALDLDTGMDVSGVGIGGGTGLGAIRPLLFGSLRVPGTQPTPAAFLPPPSSSWSAQARAVVQQSTMEGMPRTGMAQTQAPSAVAAGQKQPSFSAQQAFQGLTSSRKHPRNYDKLHSSGVGVGAGEALGYGWSLGAQGGASTNGAQSMPQPAFSGGFASPQHGTGGELSMGSLLGNMPHASPVRITRGRRKAGGAGGGLNTSLVFLSQGSLTSLGSEGGHEEGQLEPAEAERRASLDGRAMSSSSTGCRSAGTGVASASGLDPELERQRETAAPDCWSDRRTGRGDDMAGRSASSVSLPGLMPPPPAPAPQGMPMRTGVSAWGASPPKPPIIALYRPGALTGGQGLGLGLTASLDAAKCGPGSPVDAETVTPNAKRAHMASPPSSDAAMVSAGRRASTGAGGGPGGEGEGSDALSLSLSFLQRCGAEGGRDETEAPAPPSTTALGGFAVQATLVRQGQESGEEVTGMHANAQGRAGIPIGMRVCFEQAGDGEALRPTQVQGVGMGMRTPMVIAGAGRHADAMDTSRPSEPPRGVGMCGIPAPVPMYWGAYGPPLPTAYVPMSVVQGPGGCHGRGSRLSMATGTEMSAGRRPVGAGRESVGSQSQDEAMAMTCAQQRTHARGEYAMPELLFPPDGGDLGPTDGGDLCRGEVGGDDSPAPEQLDRDTASPAPPPPPGGGFVGVGVEGRGATAAFAPQKARPATTAASRLRAASGDSQEGVFQRRHADGREGDRGGLNRLFHSIPEGTSFDASGEAEGPRLDTRLFIGRPPSASEASVASLASFSSSDGGYTTPAGQPIVMNAQHWAQHI